MNQPTEERRLLTILFADLSGFTALSAKLDPEEVREAVNISFEHINKPIAAQGGTILKYEGDLVIALFGQPAAHEDDPERAVRAALGMFELMPAVNADLSARLKIGTSLGLHVGINSGTVVVGEIGSSEKREYTVMGDAVNLASRLKDAAMAGEILVSEPVFRATRYLFEYQACPPVSAKGFDQPINVFRPLKLREHPEPKRGIRGLTSPLVGRDREMATLREEAAGLAAGRGGVTFVLGDAGLGKSRLLGELKEFIGASGTRVTVLEGRCLPYSQDVPYWPLLQILERTFDINDQDGHQEILHKVEVRCQELMPADWMESAPYIGHLFSAPLPDNLAEKVRHLDAKALKVQTHLGLRKWLLALAGREPLLLVIEDYHWLDAASLELLEFLFQLPEVPPIRLLALSRMEKEGEGQRARERLKSHLGKSYKEIVLTPLDETAGSQLTYNLLHIPGVGEGFKDRLLAKSGGNPFYLEEIIRSLIDSGSLMYQHGFWRLAEDVSSLDIPDTVQAVIAARLDRLEREVREILQMAAVLGRSFHGRLLEMLSGIDHLMLTLYLATLEEFEFINETQREPELEYTFRHPLSQEVAYQALLKKHRRELHRRAGQAIEEAYPDRLDDFAEMLAHQYANSDDAAKAVEWLWRAGRKAKGRYANEQAIAFFRKLTDLLKEAPGREAELSDACDTLGELYGLTGDMEESKNWYQAMERYAGDDAVRRARARRLLADAIQKQGKFEEALKVLDSAEAVLTGRTEDELLEQAEVHILRCWILRIQGRTEDAVRQGETALRILEADLAGIPKEAGRARLAKVRVQVLNSLGGTYYTRGEYDRAIRLFKACVEICDEIGDKRLLAAAQCNLGIMHYSKGELERSLDYYRSFLGICQQIGDRKGVGAAYGNMGIVYHDLGDFDQALELYQKALDINQEMDDRMAVALNMGNLGLVYKSKGDHARAIELFTAYRDTAREIGNKQGVGVAGLNLANIYQLEGDLGRAEAQLREAEPIFTEIGDRGSLCELYTGWADLKCSQGALREAFELAGRARLLAQDINAKSRLAQVEWTYGTIHAAEGRHQLAREHLDKALGLYEETKERRPLADLCLAYARMLQQAGDLDQGRADEFLARSRALYAELGLPDRARECL